MLSRLRIRLFDSLKPQYFIANIAMCCFSIILSQILEGDAESVIKSCRSARAGDNWIYRVGLVIRRNISTSLHTQQCQVVEIQCKLLATRSFQHSPGDRKCTS